MEISYWQSRWRSHTIGWHMDKVFPPLKTYWTQLNLKPGSTILVPLCGKSLDLDWLVEQGHNVIGVDVSRSALENVMHRMSFSFEKSSKTSFICYKSPSLQLWCGDFFKLQQRWLPPVNAVYDKAALMALPPDKRPAYTSVIESLLQPETQIFLNSFEYNQDEMNGPPFAVLEEEIRTYYGHRFMLDILDEHSLFDELTNFRRRGLQSYLIEKIYHLTPH